MKITNQTCKHCVCFYTDTDEKGNLTEFHHDPNKTEGFCMIRDLFYNVKDNTPACEEYFEDTLYERVKAVHQL